MYNPTEYWTREGKTYKQRFVYSEGFVLQERMFTEYLNTLQFSTVLEMGCGFGRITKIITSNFDIKEYTAVDLSMDQIMNAMNYVNSDRVYYFDSDIQSYETDSKYDLVLASEVLMHVLPSEIRQVMARLVGWSKRHIINVDWYEDHPDEHVAPHNFHHNYKGIYTELGCRVNVIPIKSEGINTKQSIVHASVIRI